MSYQLNKVNPRNFHKTQVKFYLILIPIGLFMILPVLYILNHAFKPLDELFMFPPRFIVQKPTMNNFEMLWQTASTTGVPMSRYLFNSIIVSILAVLGNIVFIAMAGFALSKKKFRLKKTLFEINQLALMFVPIAVTITRYLIIQQTGLMNTFAVHVLPLLVMPVGLFLVKQFIDQVPDALIEAAYIDGAKDIQLLWKIVLPIISPALATVGILTFQMAWGSTESSNLFINDESLKTLAFYLSGLTDRAMEGSLAGAGMAAAAGIILFVPNLIIFIFLQSRINNTMRHSGIK